MQLYLPILFLKCFKRLLVLAYLSFTCASAFLQVNNVLKATGFPFGFKITYALLQMSSATKEFIMKTSEGIKVLLIILQLAPLI